MNLNSMIFIQNVPVPMAKDWADEVKLFCEGKLKLTEFSFMKVDNIIQGVSQKTRHSRETQTLGTSYSETINLLDLKLWQQGVLMSTPCYQSLRSNRLVVSEYEVPKVWFPESAEFFYEIPCSNV